MCSTSRLEVIDSLALEPDVSSAASLLHDLEHTGLEDTLSRAITVFYAALVHLIVSVVVLHVLGFDRRESLLRFVFVLIFILYLM